MWRRDVPPSSTLKAGLLPERETKENSVKQLRSRNHQRSNGAAHGADASCRRDEDKDIVTYNLAQPMPLETKEGGRSLDRSRAISRLKCLHRCRAAARSIMECRRNDAAWVHYM